MTNDATGWESGYPSRWPGQEDENGAPPAGFGAAVTGFGPPADPPGAYGRRGSQGRHSRPGDPFSSRDSYGQAASGEQSPDGLRADGAGPAGADPGSPGPDGWPGARYAPGPYPPASPVAPEPHAAPDRYGSAQGTGGFGAGRPDNGRGGGYDPGTAEFGAGAGNGSAAGRYGTGEFGGQFGTGAGYASGNAERGSTPGRYGNGEFGGQFGAGQYPAGQQGAGAHWVNDYEAGDRTSEYRAGDYGVSNYGASDYGATGFGETYQQGSNGYGHDSLTSRQVPYGSARYDVAEGYQGAEWAGGTDGVFRAAHRQPFEDPQGNGPGGPGGWDVERGEDDGWGEEPGDNQLMSRFGRRGGSGRKRGRRRHRWFFVALCVIAVMIVALVLGVFARIVTQWVTHRYGNYSGSGYGHVNVQVLPGDTATLLAPRLVRLGIIESSPPFDTAAGSSPSQSGLQPGIYRLHFHMNAAKAWALLLDPSARISTGVTIPEGLRSSQVIEVLSQHTDIPVSKFRQALRAPAALGLPSYASGTPEGYLFPVTYQFTPHETARQILQTMVAQFRTEAVAIRLPEAAARAHLTQSQVIVIASLVQAEAGRLSDFGMISRVIYNRLSRHMRLQFDSTILYALGRYGIRATAAELNLNSAYNTYLHAGLPPGPIDNPGDAAIQAALHPARGNWLYFITVDPAKRLTKFTNSYAQFRQWEQQAKTAG